MDVLLIAAGVYLGLTLYNNPSSLVEIPFGIMKIILTLIALLVVFAILYAVYATAKEAIRLAYDWVTGVKPPTKQEEPIKKSALQEEVEFHDAEIRRRYSERKAS